MLHTYIYIEYVYIHVHIYIYIYIDASLRYPAPRASRQDSMEVVALRVPFQRSVCFASNKPKPQTPKATPSSLPARPKPKVRKQLLRCRRTSQRPETLSCVFPFWVAYDNLRAKNIKPLRKCHRGPSVNLRPYTLTSKP